MAPHDAADIHRDTARDTCRELDAGRIVAVLRLHAAQWRGDPDVSRVRWVCAAGDWAGDDYDQWRQHIAAELTGQPATGGDGAADTPDTARPRQWRGRVDLPRLVGGRDRIRTLIAHDLNLELDSLTDQLGLLAGAVVLVEGRELATGSAAAADELVRVLLGVLCAAEIVLTPTDPTFTTEVLAAADRRGIRGRITVVEDTSDLPRLGHLPPKQ